MPDFTSQFIKQKFHVVLWRLWVVWEGGDIPDYSDAVLDVDRCFCCLGYEVKVWGWESGKIVRIF
jgi:hypothetical protein